MTTTNVPIISITPNGISAPAESAILVGRLADFQSAFGNNLNPSKSSPQGQLASAEAAILGDVNDQLLAIFNGVDPAKASGRLQDAIGRIYNLTRNPAQSTVVTCTCTGLSGTTIPTGAQAQAQDGNIYLSTESAVIPISGNVDITFAAVKTGTIACPAGYLNYIYKAIPGWDSIINSVAGVEGNDVETRANFENRRKLTLAANAQGSPQAVLGAILGVSGVLDAYVIHNPLGIDSGALFVGSINGTTLTVSQMYNNLIQVGQIIVASGVEKNTVIIANGTGQGGIGTYTVNISQNVSQVNMGSAIGGVSLKPHSLYASVYGGAAQDIGDAIWKKQSIGCDYNGNTSVTVQDTSSYYSAPYPTYIVKYQVPTPTPVLINITMQGNSLVPSDAVSQVQQAVIGAFSGSDGGSRARIGGWILASRYYAGIAILGTWAQTYQILIGLTNASHFSILMGIDQVPTIDASNITVNFI